jgi:microsomal epoxide hydrolase
MRRTVFLRASGAAFAGTVLQTPLASQSAEAAAGKEIVLEHHNAQVRGIRLHYVTAGTGPPVVLLAGWPETWYAWRHVVPLLAPHFTVIAPDLRGQGDSERPPGGYDTASLAADIHALVHQLGYKTIFLVGHDVGAWTAYAYAAAYRDEVSRLALLDAAIPGVTPAAAFGLVRNSKTWQFTFHAVPDIPEMLTKGHEREYLTWFFRTKAAHPDAIGPETIDVYVRAYASPGGMRAGFAYYRAVFDDQAQNEQSKAQPLEMPVLALGGASAVGTALRDTMRTAASNVSGGAIADCGHYIPEEQPAELSRLLLRFFEG